MTTDRDPLDILSSLAPQASDRAHLDHLRVRTLRLRAMPVRRRWSIRWSTVVVAALGLSAGGVGLATADDPVPAPVVDLLTAWGDHNPSGATLDLTHAVHVGSVPFADGLVFTVWSAQSAPGTDCYATVVERVSGVPTLLATSDEGAGAALVGCRETSGPPPDVGIVATWSAEGGETFFEVSSGDSTRATLTLPDGSVHDLVTSGGTSFGWIPVGSGPGAVTGYRSDGTVALTVTVHES